jgi:valyl-tRNA synthetase
MVKLRMYNDADETKTAALWTLKTVLTQALKLLHPFMPFITEELFLSLQDEEESIMISAWPQYREEWNFAAEENEIGTIKDAVRAIRAVRTSMNVAPARRARVFVVSEDETVRSIFEQDKVFFSALGSASEVFVQSDRSGIADDAVSTLIHNASIFLPMEELVDIEKEIARLTKEKKRLEGELARSNGMLHNERFLSKAPAQKVAQEKEKLAKYEQLMAQVMERLSQLAK